jgi:predicted Rossmann fold nucleotide-binding protein DprA/Smf involved in DNA uptake
VDTGRREAPEDPLGLSPEHRRLLSLCRRPATVADVASDTGLPVGVVRVLLADLIQQGRIKVLPQRPAGEQPSTELLREVLHGLRAL